MCVRILHHKYSIYKYYIQIWEPKILPLRLSAQNLIYPRFVLFHGDAINSYGCLSSLMVQFLSHIRAAGVRYRFYKYMFIFSSCKNIRLLVLKLNCEKTLCVWLPKFDYRALGPNVNLKSVIVPRSIWFFSNAAKMSLYKDFINSFFSILTVFL